MYWHLNSFWLLKKSVAQLEDLLTICPCKHTVGGVLWFDQVPKAAKCLGAAVYFAARRKAFLKNEVRVWLSAWGMRINI